MSKRPAYVALLIGMSFASLVFLADARVIKNYGIGALIGVGLLLPGREFIRGLLPYSFESALPLVLVNGLFYGVAVFFLLIAPMARFFPSIRLRKFPRTLDWVGIGIAAIAVVAASAVALTSAPPSDAKMMREFNQHREEFEGLATMANEDTTMDYISFDLLETRNHVAWPRPEPEWGITRARWEEYKRLFKLTGVEDGLIRDENGNVDFQVRLGNGIEDGSSKGFMYCHSSTISSPTFAPCGEHGNLGKIADGYGFFTKYRRLSGNWFLYTLWQ
jgi:hypothetical protein